MPEKLTKAEVVASIHESISLSQQDIQHVIDLFFSHLKAGLKQGTEAEFRGFGSFEIRKRAGKMKARNPKTGEPVSVPPHSIVSFRPGSDLKISVRPLRPK